MGASITLFSSNWQFKSSATVFLNVGETVLSQWCILLFKLVEISFLTIFNFPYFSDTSPISASCLHLCTNYNILRIKNFD